MKKLKNLIQTFIIIKDLRHHCNHLKMLSYGEGNFLLILLEGKVRKTSYIVKSIIAYMILY